MQSISAIQIPVSIISEGVDWITATANEGESKNAQWTLAESEFQRALDRGERIRPDSRLGYVGYSVDNFFHGRSENGTMIIASSARADDLFRSVAGVSDNVSRLDLQVTISTGSEQPHLAKQAYDLLSSRPPCSVRVRNCTYIENQPQGETLNVGKRTSDWYGRLYDKASETKCYQPRTVWRWEVEVKRRSAKRIAAYLRSHHSNKAPAREVVFNYFNRRGLLPPFTLSGLSCSQEFIDDRRTRNTLDWFRDTLSKCVQNQIGEHGRAQVLDALGLDETDNAK